MPTMAMIYSTKTPHLLINLSASPGFCQAVDAVRLSAPAISLASIVPAAFSHLQELNLRGDDLLFQLKDFHLEARPYKGTLSLKRQFVEQTARPLLTHYKSTSTATWFRWNERYVVMAALTLYGQAILRGAIIVQPGPA